MDAGFWHDKWEKNEIGFHQSDIHPMLIGHIGKLNIPAGGRVFVPLCGKTLDIGWLLAQGYAVSGAELSELAVQQLFDGLGLAPEVSEVGKCTLYKGPNIEIFVGDIFDLTPEMLGKIDGVYDRAALVALPEETRPRYAANLRYITETAPQLLITFLYDQSLMAGPPFSIPDDNLASYLQGVYRYKEVEAEPVEGCLKGEVEAEERAWILTPQ